MTHVMTDIETLATAPGAMITSIGACEFDFKTGQIGRKFYERIDWRKGQEDRIISTDTLHWWFKQSAEAQGELTKNGRPLNKVLELFKDWLPDHTVLWANGPGFDAVILEDAFIKADMGIPWKFWDVRCYRTIKMLGEPLTKELPREGTHHNALDDSLHQSKCVMSWGAALMKAAKE